MALFKELTASRTGGYKGVNATSERRIVRVIAEEADLNTGQGSLGQWSKYPDPRDLVEAQWARLGSGHPWDRTGLKALRYGILENRGAGCWVCDVTYFRNNVTLGIPPTDEWLIRYRGATVTDHALTELPPESGAAANSVWGRPSREVGSPSFKKLDAEGGTTPTGATHKARGVNKETGATVDVWLRKVDLLTEEPRGMTVEDSSFLVTFERTIPNVSHNRWAASLAPFIKAVNREEFRGAHPLHVKCVDITMNPAAAEIPGQLTSGLAYIIVLSFLWSYTEWGPYAIQPSWYDGDGHRATVLDAETSQPLPAEEFRNVRRMPFGILMAIAARGF